MNFYKLENISYKKNKIKNGYCDKKYKTKAERGNKMNNKNGK